MTSTPRPTSTTKTSDTAKALAALAKERARVSAEASPLRAEAAAAQAKADAAAQVEQELALREIELQQTRRREMLLDYVAQGPAVEEAAAAARSEAYQNVIAAMMSSAFVEALIELRAVEMRTYSARRAASQAGTTLNNSTPTYDDFAPPALDVAAMLSQLVNEAGAGRVDEAESVLSRASQAYLTATRDAAPDLAAWVTDGDATGDAR